MSGLIEQLLNDIEKISKRVYYVKIYEVHDQSNNYSNTYLIDIKVFNNKILAAEYKMKLEEILREKKLSYETVKYIRDCQRNMYIKIEMVESVINNGSVEKFVEAMSKIDTEIGVILKEKVYDEEYGGRFLDKYYI